jgi:hypothetical protein
MILVIDQQNTSCFRQLGDNTSYIQDKQRCGERVSFCFVLFRLASIVCLEPGPTRRKGKILHGCHIGSQTSGLGSTIKKLHTIDFEC